MTPPAAPRKVRIRRTREQSREEILRAAETLLRDGGVDAVTVRAVGAAVGVTDAAVNHHFGTREALLTALLRHGGRKLKDAINSAVAEWESADASLERLVDAIADIYADGTYGNLALQLHLSGWRDAGSGMLNPVVDALHALRLRRRSSHKGSEPPIEETRFMVGLMHEVLALDAVFGAAFRRSAGLLAAAEPPLDTKKRLWTALFGAMLSTSSAATRGSGA